MSRADRHTIERDGQPPLAFDGFYLGSGSSRRDDKPRWTEIHIYVTEGDKFVVHVAGMSNVPGEVARNTVSVHDDAASMVKGMARRHGLSFVARCALEEAAEMDDEVRTALDLQQTADPEFID